MIRDYNIEWLEEIEYLPAQVFQTYVTGAGISDGAPVFAEVAASGISGISIDAADDAIATVWHMGNRVDITKQIRFRVALASSGGAGDTETATVTYTPLNASGATVLIDPATALSTAVPIHTYVAGDAFEWTGFGKINGKTLADTTCALALKVAVSMGTASTTEQTLMGLEVRYTPRRTAGPRRNVLGGKRLVITRPLGVQLISPGQEGL